MKSILRLTLCQIALACVLPLHAAERDASAVPQGLAASDWSSIRAACEAGRHGFFKQSDGTHTAHNHAQGWQMCFDGRGFIATPEGRDWSWGLELQVAALDEQRQPVATSANRLEINHTPTLTEWFVNDGRGLEQGWTIHSKPEGSDAALRLDLAVRGSLKAEGEGQSVRFVKSDGSTVLNYGGLKAWDASGKTLPATMRGEGEHLRITVDQTGAQYPITIDPIAQMAYLKASNSQASDWFGYSVAVSGDTVVVGAYNEDSNATGINGNQADNAAKDAGAVYVFVRHGNSWSQQAYLKGSNTEWGDHFGFSVSLSGDTLVVGAPSEEGAATGINGNQADNSLKDAGAAYVFVRSGSTWSQQAYLKASNTASSDFFGVSVAVSGNTVVVGADGESSAATGVNGNQADNSAQEAGAAYVFVRSGSTWSQQAYLKASNTGADDQFGDPVAISGDTIVVGAPWEDSGATGINGNQADNGAQAAGAAYVFVRSGNTWSQQAYLKASNAQANDYFSWGLAVSGDTVVIGAPLESSNALGVNGNQADNTASRSGAAYVFVRSGSTWSQQAYLKASNTGMNDEFGTAVSVSGDIVVVGAPYEASNATGINGNQANDSATDAGAAYLFERNGGIWSQQAYVKSLTNRKDDYFGNAVAVSGDLLVAGAPKEDSNATGINGDGTNVSALDAGAAYVMNLGEVLTSLAKTTTSAPGNTNIAFGTLGQGAISPAGETLFQSSLVGSGAPAGYNSAIFSTVGGTSVDMAFQIGSFVSGMKGLPANAKIATLSNPSHNRSAGREGIFQATVSGTGITTTNNRLIFADNGAFIRPIARTGVPVTEFGGAVPMTFDDVLQGYDSSNFIVTRYALKAGVAGVTTASDSGLQVMLHDGTISFTSAREGQLAYGGGGTFGQFGRHSACGNYIGFFAKFIPTAGTPVDRYFYVLMNGASASGVATYTQGAVPPGALAATEKFGTFTGITARSGSGLIRATVTGSVTAKNEGVWDETNGLMLRKGETDLGGGLKPASIVRVWGGFSQMLAQVTLTGPGVTSANNQALVLRQSSGTFLILLRSGQVAPGIGNNKLTIGGLQAVDVDPVNGNYAVLTSLVGAASTANQALFSGNTTVGNDTTFQHLRLPKLRLQKGDRYYSTETPKDKIASLSIKPFVDASGVGGRGQGRIINSSGEILVEITGDRAVKELVKLTP